MFGSRRQADDCQLWHVPLESGPAFPRPTAATARDPLMILSGHEIRRELGRNILIDPFDESRLNPNSYNLSLHD